METKGNSVLLITAISVPLALLFAYLSYALAASIRIAKEEGPGKGSKWWIFALFLFIPIRWLVNIFARVVIYPFFLGFNILSFLSYSAYSAHIDMANNFLAYIVSKYERKDLKITYTESDGRMVPSLLNENEDPEEN